MARKRDKRGYVRVWVPGRGWVLEHRLVMETHLGRLLTPDERVHHLNEDKSDNRLQNLELCASHREHHQRHLRLNYERIAVLYASGSTTRQVADTVGASVGGVRHALRLMGLVRTRSQAARLRVRGQDGRFTKVQA